MRNRNVTLVDLGLDHAFNTSMGFVQASIDNINVGYDEPVIDVNYVRTRDVETILKALTTPCSVLHVMAHGDSSAEPAFFSTDERTSVSLTDLTNELVTNGWGVAASTVIADGCRTGTGVWQRAMRDCLQGPITYVGTSADVGWYEGTVFSSAFYGALTRDRGKGRTGQAQGVEASRAAAKAYELITKRRCPYRAIDLTPSRRATRAIRG